MIIFCLSPGRRPRKIICGANELFLASGQRSGHLIFDTSFDFQCATPRGLIRDTIVGGTAPRNKGISIFHCAIPRGLIRDTTVGGTAPRNEGISIFH